MKILKIELQNINSLKCDKPIIIDFEDKHFQDIGLYAITGSTGAGKTTILDAITIALYHQVPRFNRSNSKAGLENVVSYGAVNALARVLFENKGERFEAFWSMRMASKSGKKLTNPKEEVRLKNLSSERIIAEKKRDVQLEVERVTQLNYNQFLRSVMLAQGEFASFLSASAKDKGTLLEQITGEEIYKKIGEAINQRQYDERKKLDAVKAKINTEDLLNDEQRTELKIEQKDLEIQIIALEKEFQTVKKITDWYKRSADLLRQKDRLQLQLEDLKHDLEKNTGKLKKLEYHKKAEPFKELLDDLKRTKKQIKEKTDQQNRLEQSLKLLLLEVTKIKEKTAGIEQLLKEKESNFKKWLPKLDHVSKLDANIANENDKKEKISTSLSELEVTISDLKEKKGNLKKTRLKHTSELEIVETFVKKSAVFAEIEKHFTGWNTRLTNLRNIKISIKNDTDFCTLKEKEEQKIQIDLDKIKKNHFNLNKKLSEAKKELEQTELLLKNNDLGGLLKQKEELETKRMQWRSFLEMSGLLLKHQDSERLILKDTEKLEIIKQDLQKQLIRLTENIEKARQGIDDAERIVELEKKIKSFEEERGKLEKGKPCDLCGSTEHPYVEKYSTLKISVSQVDLKKRKKLFEKLLNDNVLINSELTKTNTRISANNEQLTGLRKEIDHIKLKARTTDTGISVTDTALIKNKLAEFDSLLKELDRRISSGQDLQKQKDRESKVYNKVKEDFGQITTKIARLEENLKNITRELSEKEKTIKLNKDIAEKLSLELSEQLNNYDLELPDTHNTALFISNLQKKISEYNIKTQKLQELKNKISVLDVNLSNTKKSLHKNLKEQKDLQKNYSTILKDIAELSEKRNSVLPLDISIEMKRSSLQKISDKYKDEFESASSKLRDLNTKKTSNETQQQVLKKELVILNKHLKELRTLLKTQIVQSEFDNEEEILNALLDHKTEKILTGIKKDLDNKTVELGTLEKKLNSELEILTKEKDFDISAEEAAKKENEIKSLRDNLFKRVGEIRQRFSMDDQIILRNKSVFDEISLQEKEVKKWKDLMDLLGGSKHAFNTYVQRLTLQSLIGYANLHLYKLNKRYSLKMNEAYKTGEELNFNLIDHYQTDKARYVDTSSGGEKFIISLALALGLSDLASSNVRIDSLFIDEGFGTLDNNTLETVISTLETLKSQGKMIGIISHVENLKERIPSQIQIHKKSSGVSEVVIV